MNFRRSYGRIELRIEDSVTRRVMSPAQPGLPTSQPVTMSINSRAAAPITPPLQPGDSVSVGIHQTEPLPVGVSSTAAPALPVASYPPNGFLGGYGGMSSPFSQDKIVEPPAINRNYDRVLDLYPDANDRRLIEQVREAVEQTEIGVDVTDEDWITVRGGGRRITWGGRLETDTVNWANDQDFSGQSNYVEFRRLRLMAAGDGYGIYDYQLELEFAPEADDNRIDAANEFGVEVKDAFIGIREVPFLGYTVIGHFRTPIGLSSLTSTRFVPFMERSLPNRLLPGRELGIAAFNSSRESEYDLELRRLLRRLGRGQTQHHR